MDLSGISACPQKLSTKPSKRKRRLSKIEMSPNCAIFVVYSLFHKWGKYEK
jgi:hypothetical protein